MIRKQIQLNLFSDQMNLGKNNLILETIDLDLEKNNLRGESGKLKLEKNNLDLLIIYLNLLTIDILGVFIDPDRESVAMNEP